MRTWIFGYGSLIFPWGINGRGMVREYAESDLHLARLSGYRRAWNAYYRSELYLGISPKPDSTVNGVIFTIDAEDMPAFLKSEGFGTKDSNYNLEDVTDLIDAPVGLYGDKVFTCVTKNPDVKGMISTRYQNIVEEGLQHRGSEFRDEFFRTTDWSNMKGRKIIDAWKPELLGPE